MFVCVSVRACVCVLYKILMLLCVQSSARVSGRASCAYAAAPASASWLQRPCFRCATWRALLLERVCVRRRKRARPVVRACARSSLSQSHCGKCLQAGAHAGRPAGAVQRTRPEQPGEKSAPLQLGQRALSSADTMISIGPTSASNSARSRWPGSARTVRATPRSLRLGGRARNSRQRRTTRPSPRRRPAGRTFALSYATTRCPSVSSSTARQVQVHASVELA